MRHNPSQVDWDKLLEAPDGRKRKKRRLPPIRDAHRRAYMANVKLAIRQQLLKMIRPWDKWARK